MLSNDLSIKLYQSIAEDNTDRVFEHWHASSIAECPRTHYFHRLGVKPLNRPSAAKILRWGAGHHLEKSIRQHVDKLYKDVVSNQRLTSKALDLTGEFDNYSETEKTLIEVKSVSDYAFYEKDTLTGLKEVVGKWPNGQRKWDIKKEPYLHHQLQQHAYMLLLAEQNKQVEKIDYIYISLSGRVVAYKTKPDPKLTENVKARLVALNEAWKIKTPPNCICIEGHALYDGVMQWCDYKTEGECCSLDLIKEQVNGKSN